MMKDTLLELKNPLQYLDDEVNAVRKDFAAAAARIALAFPDLYELGMSNQGMKILYEIVNAREEYLAERVFAPWLDREAQLRRDGQPLAALESGRPLAHFDVLGFTLPYELTYTNILTMLDLAQLPLLARDRDERHPLIAGGGPGAFNPEPLADFFDFFLLGDGEEAILEIMDAVRQARAGGENREAQLERLARIEGVYVPRWYRAAYDAAGRFAALVPLRDGAPARIRKRILADLDAAPFPVRPPVPFVETTHDRITIEIARGCIQRCRFCQAGTTYRPYRERSARQVLALAESGLAATGYDELSLAALSCGDHRRIEALIGELMARYEQRRVSISLPSLRPGTITDPILREIGKVKRTGFTIAPEAGTQRLRDVISKGVTEEVILETCRRLFARGWSGVKLYFMVGLPTETEADRAGIVALVEKIRRLGRELTGRKPAVSAAVSSFVPKPLTPFQWSAQVLPGALRPIHAKLREELQKRGATFKWHHPEISALEGLLARGDRRLGRVIRLAWEKGRRFDGWTEQFSLAPWLEACGEAGIDFEEFVGRERDVDEPLPWDHLGYPAQSAFLREERERALAGAPSPPCVPDACEGCGLCEDLPVHRDTAPEPAAAAPAPRPQLAVERLRLEYAKVGTLRYLSHLGLARAIQRLFRRARVPLAFSQGHSPHP
ncbi:MAG TPA: TIGR03960 family B12-binding radical SAM protein, partial [Candidatus Methanoperedens sp.]|nr:TIGR03960 family B12-binding radical SAM protein [Candidatus Methanoperedens sp.]